MDDEIKRTLKNIEALLFASMIKPDSPTQVKIKFENGQLHTEYYTQTEEEMQMKKYGRVMYKSENIMPLEELEKFIDK